MTNCANLLESSKYSFDVWTFSLTHHDLLYGGLDKACILQQYNSFLQHTNKHTCNVVQYCSTKKKLLKYEFCTLSTTGVFTLWHIDAWQRYDCPVPKYHKNNYSKVLTRIGEFLLVAWGKFVLFCCYLCMVWFICSPI